MDTEITGALYSFVDESFTNIQEGAWVMPHT